MLFGTFNVFSQTVEQREEFLKLLNTARIEHGLDTLIYETTADSAADYRLNSICGCLDTLSKELYQEDYKKYFHYNLSKDLDSINRHVFPIETYPEIIGECVYRANIFDLVDTLKYIHKSAFYGWMDSYWHREAMMMKEFKYVGLRLKKCKTMTMLILVMYKKGYLDDKAIKRIKERRKREGRL
jgi:hypothetical protein